MCMFTAYTGHGLLRADKHYKLQDPKKKTWQPEELVKLQHNPMRQNKHTDEHLHNQLAWQNKQQQSNIQYITHQLVTEYANKIQSEMHV